MVRRTELEAARASSRRGRTGILVVGERGSLAREKDVSDDKGRKPAVILRPNYSVCVALLTQRRKDAKTQRELRVRG